MTESSPPGIEPLASLPAELSRLAVGLGHASYRGRQIFEWLHRRRVTDWERMTNLPAALRERLAAGGPALPLRAGRTLRSEDGTRKLRVLLNDGLAVETVLIPEDGRLTQCVSTQVGCAVRCAFCRSGRDGLRRNLTASEIVGQVHLAAAAYLPGERLRNVVLMGVGEPLHNLERVLRALEVLAHPRGLDLSSRRVTVSTVGIPAGIERLGEATGGAAALAVSLHAADAGTRARLVPGVKASPAEIVGALERYPLPRRRRLTIEYVLVDGVNDRPEDARALARLLAGLRVKINLLPLNPHDRTDLRPPAEERVLAFQRLLTDRGLSAFLRRRRGADIGAACGQLSSIEAPADPIRS